MTIVDDIYEDLRMMTFEAQKVFNENNHKEMVNFLGIIAYLSSHPEIAKYFEIESEIDTESEDKHIKHYIRFCFPPFEDVNEMVKYFHNTGIETIQHTFNTLKK